MRLVSLTELIQWFHEETTMTNADGNAHEGDTVREIDARDAS